MGSEERRCGAKWLSERVPQSSIDGLRALIRFGEAESQPEGTSLDEKRPC